MPIPIELEKANIPLWSLNYLINNDADGMSEEEKDLVDTYIEEWKSEGYDNITVDDSDEIPFFTHSPAFGTESECTEVKVWGTPV